MYDVKKSDAKAQVQSLHNMSDGQKLRAWGSLWATGTNVEDNIRLIFCNCLYDFGIDRVL